MENHEGNISSPAGRSVDHPATSKKAPKVAAGNKDSEKTSFGQLPIEALTISLKRRHDRIEVMRKHFEGSILDLNFQEGTDGKEIKLDEELRQRVHPWNFENLSEKELRGVIGCGLSHLKMWEKISKRPPGLYLVMEDDARYIDRSSEKFLKQIVRDAPEDADLIWLNDWERPPELSFFRRIWTSLDRRSGSARLGTKLRRMFRSLGANFGKVTFKEWSATIEKTTEGYLLSPSYAKFLHNAIINHLGAIDEHMRAAVKQSDGKVLVVSPAVFTQDLAMGSDIQEQG